MNASLPNETKHKQRLPKRRDPLDFVVFDELVDGQQRDGPEQGQPSGPRYWNGDQGRRQSAQRKGRHLTQHAVEKHKDTLMDAIR